jgi:hypothetical protein
MLLIQQLPTLGFTAKKKEDLHELGKSVPER